MSTNANDSASGYGFPSDHWLKEVQSKGLTKREHFAAMAMQGLCSRQIPIDFNSKESIEKKAWSEWVGQMSVEMADELIAALNANQ